LSEFAEGLKEMTDIANDENLSALNGDVNGRMTKAFDGDKRFNRWGKHYLRALTRSH
jgi:hypothetical protein